ncbi:MAG TPA: polyprenyl synthetase family protein, partial [Anaerolineales bacterium]|nr:polyprenyl synthetase family protein [Anaerolineales bacterium]
MDIHTQLIAEVSNIPYLKEWEELQALFRRVASGRPGHWLLPLHVCQAVGGTEEQAIPAIVAVACSHIGIVLVDDMLDVDPRGEHVKIGESAVANMASSLQAAALVAISTSRLGADAKLTAMEGVNEMFLETTLGQHWDVTSIVQDEDSYWRIARAKSSPFFGASFQVGALMGGASVEIANQIREVGRLYGEMIQIHDDVNDT